MNAERWERIEELFLTLIGEAPASRDPILAKACGGDSGLRAEVERMLAAHGRGSSFIESPAFDIAAREPVEAQPTLPAGSRLGHYAIRGVLGSGGMGVVYDAEQDSPRRLVALKVMRALPYLDELTPRLFRREGQALARLEHPGIAAIYEAGHTDDGWYYFAMERVRGVPLTEHFRKVEKSKNQKVEIGERLELFVKVCEAVHYAHQRGVIHRDLKPSNILVGDVGAVSDRDRGFTPGSSRSETAPTAQPKILDFGLARITDPDAKLTARVTSAGGVWGTPAYMSPEQALGRSDDIDVRSDVYSLGVILYELLADRLPYDVAGLSLSAAVRTIVERPPRPLRTVDRSLRGDLETIVGKSLEKEPARRYASVSQLASDITHYLHDEPIAARPASTAYQLRKLIARHKTPFILAVVLFLAVASFAVIAAVQAVRIGAERDKSLVAQRRESEARESAEEVAGFLEKLFQQADPGQQKSADPKVRDLLEAGVAKLDVELADQPLVYARLADVLGGVYTELADYPRARRLLESAIAIRQRELGEAHPDVADSLIKLAGCTGDGDRSHRLLMRALEIRRSFYGEPHEQVASALEDLGAARFYAGDNVAAVEYFRKSLDMRRELGAEDRQEIAMALNNLGIALSRLGRLDEAEQALLAALEMKRRVASPDVCKDAVSIGLTLEALAHIPYDRGDFAAAEQYLAEQVEAFRRGCPPHHPKIAWGLRNYAFVVEKNHGPAVAEPIFREALAIQVAAFGEQHPEVSATLVHLAHNRLAQDDLEGAIELNGKALEIRRAVLGETHDQVAHTLRTQGQWYRRSERFDEAEAALLEGHAILTGNHGEHNKQSQGIAQALIALYEDQDQCDLAEKWRSTLAQGGK